MDYNNNQYDNNYQNNDINNGAYEEEVEYLDFEFNTNYQETTPTRLTEEDLTRIDRIFNTKSKNEKMGLFGTLGLGPLCILFVVLSFVRESKFLPIMIAILSGILAIMFLVIYLIAYGKRKKIYSRDDIDIIKAELAGDEVTVFASAKVYLTKNYIFSHGAYSNVVKYEDIALIYNERRISKVNGVRIDNGIFVIAILNSGRNINLLRTYNEQDMQMIEQVILEHNPNIMMGMNSENKAKLKEIKQNYKNAKKGKI